MSACCMPDCDRPIVARKMCRSHYNRWHKHGTVDEKPIASRAIPHGTPLAERIRLIAPADPDSGCWEWSAYKDRAGYGYIGVDRKNRRAHRVSYETFVGPIPPGLELDHLCRNRACVNPEHLEPVTAAVNNRRSNGPAAINARKTHCSKGHAFDEANTYITPDGGRTCRTCNNAASAAYKARRRSA